MAINFDSRPVGTRISSGKSCTPQDLENIKLIRNKVSCAMQALDPRNIPNPPLPPIMGTSPEMTKQLNDARSAYQDKVAMFVKGALDSKAEAVFLEEMWWTDMLKKYTLSGSVYIDFETGEFYSLEQESSK